MHTPSNSRAFTSPGSSPHMNQDAKISFAGRTENKGVGGRTLFNNGASQEGENALGSGRIGN